MRPRHLITTLLAHLRRLPALRAVTLTTALLVALWLHTLHWGERRTFTSHIRACDWRNWESWPSGATPHRLALVADPQLVDPHTYPGRPWPLEGLTEVYTDRYMARAFRGVMGGLEPDGVVFLGDLFDGGREWGMRMTKGGFVGEFKEEGGEGEGGLEKRGRKKKGGNGVDAAAAAAAAEYKRFVPGEEGRWSRWGREQWMEDFARFARIFWSEEQLNPGMRREMFPAFEVDADEVSVANGAENIARLEYASAGTKKRQLIASLPGNHDVGFGAGVQEAVRDRFNLHFGDSNRIDIIGNHTFVSLDTPSLSGRSQFPEPNGKQRKELKHIWKPTMEFMEDLRTPSHRLVADALERYYPERQEKGSWQHLVMDADEASEDLAPLHALPETDSQLPVVLLSHVPLYRQPDTDCGNLRENGHAIRVAMGYQYQNVLTQPLSKEIVTKVSAAGNIATIFSGDDHDYCDVMHKYNIDEWHGWGDKTDKKDIQTQLKHIKEVTVKSFSWAMGVRKPGFQLVSLWNPVDVTGKSTNTHGPTTQTHLCLLPDQLSIFIDYVLLLAFTLAVLLLRAIILSLRPPPPSDPDQEPSSRFTLPITKSRLNGLNGHHYASHPKIDITSPPEKEKDRRSRNRASSTSTSTQPPSAHAQNPANLSVQRSHNARTRSVSPAAGAQASSNNPYPAIRWTDPSEADEDDSDEESHVGAEGLGWEDDSQGKWKWRRRVGPGKARCAVEEFGRSMLVVGGPALGLYFYLIWTG